MGGGDRGGATPNFSGQQAFPLGPTGGFTGAGKSAPMGGSPSQNQSMMGGWGSSGGMWSPFGGGGGYGMGGMGNWGGGMNPYSMGMNPMQFINPSIQPPKLGQQWAQNPNSIMNAYSVPAFNQFPFFYGGAQGFGMPPFTGGPPTPSPGGGGGGSIDMGPGVPPGIPPSPGGGGMDQPPGVPPGVPPPGGTGAVRDVPIGRRTLPPDLYQPMGAGFR